MTRYHRESGLSFKLEESNQLEDSVKMNSQKHNKNSEENEEDQALWYHSNKTLTIDPETSFQCSKNVDLIRRHLKPEYRLKRMFMELNVLLWKWNALKVKECTPKFLHQ